MEIVRSHNFLAKETNDLQSILRIFFSGEGFKISY